MFALPGQTAADIEDDLAAVIDLGAPHVSLYGLTFEPDTPFERALAQGRLIETNELEWRKQYDCIRQTLKSAGYEQYEVSNFAKPGQQSLHNQLYWSDRHYMGLGPSAHGYRPDGLRTRHLSDISGYMSGSLPVEETPTPKQRAQDMLVGGLRSVAGLDLERMAHRTGLTANPKTIDSLQNAGLIDKHVNHLYPTHEGYPVCDSVVRLLAQNLISISGRRSP